MLIGKILWYSIFIPFIVGTRYYKRLQTSHKFLYAFVCSGVLTELTSRFIKKILDVKNNMPLGHAYITISFALMAMFYLCELKGFVKEKIIIGIVILFTCFSIINVSFFQSYYSYPSIAGATSALLLVTFAIMLFTRIMIEAKIKILSKSSLAWINSAVLIYYSGNFFFYILFNIILSYSEEFTIKTLNFFSILYFIFYGFIAIGFWHASRIPGKNSN